MPADEQQQIAAAFEEDAHVVSDTQLQAVLTEEPPEVQDEVLAINSEARDLALQVALLIPLLAALLGIFNSFRMVRLPDIEPASPTEGLDWA